MKLPKSLVRKLPKFLRPVDNLAIVAIVFVLPLLVVVALFVRGATQKTSDVYAKVKLSQGLWWASSKKPSLWFAEGIKKGETEKSLLGSPTAEILEVRYYPYQEENTSDVYYDVYISLKLGAGKNEKTGKYTFKRSGLAVGAPIELDFPSSQITGTVIELSETPFEGKKTLKTLTLVLEEGYTRDNPRLYDSIKIGDVYFDGEENVFEIISKRLERSTVFVGSAQGMVFERQVTSRQNILVEAKVLTSERGGQLIWGEEKVLSAGSYLGIITPSFNFKEFVVSFVD